jgi:hypothetical protein
MDHQTPALFTRGEISTEHLPGRVGEQQRFWVSGISFT